MLTLPTTLHPPTTQPTWWARSAINKISLTMEITNELWWDELPLKLISVARYSWLLLLNGSHASRPSSPRQKVAWPWRTVGETNLYDKEIMPSSLTSFSGHTRSRLHEKHQISSICACPLTSINSKCESVTAGGVARSLARRGLCFTQPLPNFYPSNESWESPLHDSDVKNELGWVKTSI